jgi:ribosomal-protein-alanine N-acetyltransferase
MTRYARIPDEFPLLRAGDFILRSPEPGDAAVWFARNADPDVVFPTSADLMLDISEAVGGIEWLRHYFGEKTDLRWAIAPPGGGAAIGDIGFHAFHQRHLRAELGYVLSKEWWGRGVATACGRACIDYGFGVLGLNRIEATVMEGNERSLAVLRKLGFTTEGLMREYKIARGEPGDFWMLGLTRGEWQARA